MNNKDKIKSTVNKYVFEEDEILAVLLFGSANTGNMGDESDIDIALMMYPGKKLDLAKKMFLIKELSFQLGRIVDIGEISSMNLIYSCEAINKGDILLAKDKDLFEMKRADLLGMYLQFNHERQEIIHAYSAG